MERLIQAKLFGGDLLEVNLPQLVQRYNECLERLGIEPTALARFRLDGMGWSPEIAQEKQNGFYLSAGEANPMAVVLLPEQRTKPIYFPYNSYDQELLSEYFKQFGNEIIDITVNTAIGLDIDQELTRYQSPRDLMLVQYIIVRSVCGGLAERAAEQRTLVNRFLGDGPDWFDAELRGALIECVKRSGDLRYRRVEIPDMIFKDVRTFHTEAFGGTFVIRGLSLGRGMLVLEKPEAAQGMVLSLEEVYGLFDEKLVARLLSESLVTVGATPTPSDLAFLQHKKDCLAASIIFADDPEANLAAMTPAQRKQRLSSIRGGLPEIYHELERLTKLVNGGKAGRLGNISAELLPFILQPNPRLTGLERQVIWKLVSLIRPLDVLQLYRFDKSQFFETYVTWPPKRKEWAAALLSKRKELKVNELYD